MHAPQTYAALEAFGRVRLSRHFYMRNFLYSEIGNFYGRFNTPQTPDFAIAAGQSLCQGLLDPLVESFGPITVRSSYRSSDLNHFGATQVKPQKCSRNPASYAGHIWDIRDNRGRMGACVCIVVPWFADQYDQGRDWREDPDCTISSYIAPRGKLLAAGAEPCEDAQTRADRYADFPCFRGIAYPELPRTPQHQKAAL